MSRPPDESLPEDAAVPYDPPARAAPRSRALEVKERNESRLLELPGVEGVGLTERGGREAILLYLHDEDAQSGVPSEVEGVEVACEVSGPIEAQ